MSRKLRHGAGLPLSNSSWERLLSCKGPPFLPPYYKSLKKNAGPPLGGRGGGGEQRAPVPVAFEWSLQGK